MSKQAKAIIEGHLQEFFRGSIDGVVRDYAEDAIFIVPNGPLHGPSEIKKFFTKFIGDAPAGFMQSFELQRREFVGELGYITWAAAPWVQFATDTFVVRNGKIVLQTFAAHPASW